ncbi:MAG: 16S rRNA (cytidine(1402)-2'-O)-methyltransferase [Acidobacteriota bacterium]|nr:16S rRNA (cytidine(1402)-2'-O)-methyltransferase [Acidobacteriota bacterium]
MSESTRQGTLNVVASPIGNLSDVSRRALDVLRAADIVIAEDTRHSRKLLAHFGIQRRLMSMHRFSEASKVDRLIDRLREGLDLALLTDGGTPTISDPGHRLVRAALEAGIAVVPIPGPSAVTAALSVSGLPADRFLFAGFLPSRAQARRRALRGLAAALETIVLFEAPHRLLASLADLEEVLGDREAVLCRELTKRHEEILRGPVSDLRERLAARDGVRGEIVLVLAPSESGAAAGSPADERLRGAYRDALAAEEGDARRALRRLSRELGVPRADLKRKLDLMIQSAREGRER